MSEFVELGWNSLDAVEMLHDFSFGQIVEIKIILIWDPHQKIIGAKKGVNADRINETKKHWIGMVTNHI